MQSAKRHQGIQARLKLAPIGEIRQRIEIRQARHFHIAPLNLRRVRTHAAPAVEFAFAIDQRFSG